MSDLTKELATYESNLPSLVKSAGKYVVIRGEAISGTYDTYSDALKFAYREFGTDAQFLVKKISPIDQVSFITRVAFQECPA